MEANNFDEGDVKKVIGDENPMKIGNTERKNEAAGYENSGIIWANSGNFTGAIDYHEKALKIFKDIKDNVGESKCYRNLGNAYAGLGNFKKAIDYHKKSLQIALKIGDKVGESACYTNLWNIYYRLDNDKKAKKYFEKLPTINEKQGIMALP